MKLSKSMTQAKQTIFEQDAPLAVRRSAWVLYQHELTRIDPSTSKLYTPRRALANTRRWMAEQKERRKRKRPTPMQRQILYLLVVEGLSQKQIAYRLRRTDRVIKMHFSQMRVQMGLKSLHQVVAVAVERGWIDAPKLED